MSAAGDRPRRPLPRGLRWALELAALVLVFVVVQQWQTRNLLPTDSGQPAPPLAGALLSGGALDADYLAGRPALVYFFAPWCKVCALSAPGLRGLREAYTEDQLAIVLVALSYDSDRSVRQYVDRHALTMPVLLGLPETAENWKIVGFPTYYLLDGGGRVVSRDFGLSTPPGLRARAYMAQRAGSR